MIQRCGLWSHNVWGTAWLSQKLLAFEERLCFLLRINHLNGLEFLIYFLRFNRRDSHEELNLINDSLFTFHFSSCVLEKHAASVVATQRVSKNVSSHRKRENCFYGYIYPEISGFLV